METSDNKAGRPGSRLAGLLAGKTGRILCLLALLAFFGGFNASIAGKESLLANGQRMVLALAPVDPLSLMQGFYMELDFQVGRSIESAVNQQFSSSHGYNSRPAERELRGLAVLRERDGIYQFVRLHDPGVALRTGEQLLAYKMIYNRYRGNVQISGGSFFFEEGLAELYDSARFAELRVAEDGTALITNLLDSQFRVIDKSMLKE